MEVLNDAFTDFLGMVTRLYSLLLYQAPAVVQWFLEPLVIDMGGANVVELPAPLEMMFGLAITTIMVAFVRKLLSSAV